MKQFILSKGQLFTTAFLQVTFVAMNTVFITSGEIGLMLLAGFMISWFWTGNTKKIAFGDKIDRIVYATGAMMGTGVGYLIANFLKMIV